MLQGKRVLIGISGGIAAYKVCDLISSLFKAGAEVRVILTPTAAEFITPLTVSTLSRHPAYTDREFWQATHSRPLHIELGEWADVLAIAPLTANTLGKLTHGLADNLLTNTVLASRCPILLAPAMNTEMWEQQAVQNNWHQLLQNPRYRSIGPSAGLLACDRVGTGRMAEPASLFLALRSLLHTQGQQDLRDKRILINAGGTREHLDPVRFIGNPSTGKMGIALAQAALHRGAAVTLVCAPMDRELLRLLADSALDLRLISATTAEQMRRVMWDYFPYADWSIASAAVADVRPTIYTPHKLPKSALPSTLPLSPVVDIAAELGQRKQPHQRLVGFAAQTGDIVKPALEKLQRKRLDAIAANPIDRPNAGFGSDTNQAVFIDKTGRQEKIEPCPKLEFAHRLLDFVQTIPASGRMIDCED